MSRHKTIRFLVALLQWREEREDKLSVLVLSHLSFQSAACRMLLNHSPQQNELLSCFCSNVEMLLRELVPWMKGWFVRGALCPAQGGNEGSCAPHSHRQVTVPVAQQGHAARGLCSSRLCCRPDAAGAGAVKVSRPNCHQETTGKDTNFPQGATAKVGTLIACSVLSKSKLSALTFNSNKTSNACLKLYASC